MVLHLELLPAEVVGNGGDLWQVVISSPTFPGVNHVGDVCLENQGGQKRDKGGVVWFGMETLPSQRQGKLDVA